MPRKRKQIRFAEDGGDEDWSGSSSSSSRSSIASFHRESYPRHGTTRIPADLVSKRALVALGYPFVEEGAAIVLLVALDERLIDEVLKLSEEYRRSDAGADGSNGTVGRPISRPGDRGFDWVNVEVPAEDGWAPNPDHGEASDYDLDSTFGDTGRYESEGPIAHSGVLGLNTTKAFWENTADLTAGRFPSWNEEKSDLINGTTRLYSVHAAEFYMDREGNQRVTLVCPNDPGNGLGAPSLVRMRWLHLQLRSLNLGTLENHVADCPYISHPLKLVALTVLKEVAVRCTRPSETGLYIEPGSTIQYVGRYNTSLGSYPGDAVSDTQPVVFLCAPHLVLAEKASQTRHNGIHHTRSLLEVLYGYDNGSRENARLVRGGSEDPTTLQVPQLWSLVVGADLIITCSELSAEEVRGDLVTIDGIDSETGVYTIRLIDEKDTFRYNIVIKPDCKYVDFLKHAVSLVSKGRSNAATYDLVDDSGVLITADTWLRLLAEGSIEEYVFCLRPRHAAHRAPDEDFRALSARLTAGSRSSLGRYSRRSSLLSGSGSARHDMQMVLHPNMWEYGAGSPSSHSTDSAEGEGSDEDVETSTMCFGSHLNGSNSEGLSIDGIVDLTSSASETSLRLREQHMAPSARSISRDYVPELFDMDRHAEFRRGQGNTKNEMPLGAEKTYPDGVPDMRFILRRRETAWSAESRETGPTRPPSSGQRSADQSRNPSRASSFTYARGSPLEPEPLPSSFGFHETPGSTLPRRSPYRNRGLGPTLDAFLGSDFERSPLPLDTPDADFVPFLAWRLTWKDDRRSRAEIDRTLLQLLSNLNAGLESDRVGKWYRAAFECTQAQLLERFQCLLGTVSPRPVQSEAVHEAEGISANCIIDDPLDTSAAATADSGSLGRAQHPEENLDAADTCARFPPRESTLFGSTDVDTADGLLDSDGGSFHRPNPNSTTGAEPDDASSITRNSYSKTLDEFLLRRVLDVSRDVFGAFLPRDGSFVAHTMCKRFWGSVDTMLRQIRWSFDVRDATEKESWIVIRPPSAGNDLSPDCRDCQQGKAYESAEDALGHWHSNHTYTPCSKSAERGRPFDDPCVVLLRRRVSETGTTTTRPPDPRRHDIISSAEEFCGQVQSIVDQTEELHKLVSSVTASDDPVSAYSRRPHLPSSLVNAFEGILGLFVLKSKELSWMNRFAAKSGSPYSRNAEDRLGRLREAGASASRRVREHLVRAKEDIIMLGTTRGDSERVIIAPVGPEFLAACLVSSLQNDVAVPGNTERKLDLVAHYRKRISRLWLDTNRKPKRGAFVAIHALEEELEALRVVVASQQCLLRSYQALLSPMSFASRTTDRLYYKERKASFNLENKCIRRQQRRLAERDKALSILQRKARTLRDETKQRIEILDEGHGKAIRVFTIVTLFFLPLSFVTSFFGMNTADIRDTSRDQKVFWISALPVTFGVLGLAFLYGYKWDTVLAWVPKTIKPASRSATTPHGFRGKEQLTWTTATVHKDSGLPVHYERSSPAGWKNKVPFLSRRKSRAKTDDSLFRP